MTIADMVERLRRIPDSARTYTCDEHFARLHFGLDVKTLRELVDAGLPHLVDDGRQHYEYGDLHYIGLRNRSASTFIWAARKWAAGLELFARRDRTPVTISYVPQLPHAVGPLAGVAHLPDGTKCAVSLENGRSALETRVVLRGSWPALPLAAARVLDEVAASIGFCPLPTTLQGDTQTARAIGLSDCFTAAHVIVEEWEGEGLEARVAHGMLVSLPYSTPHTWPEVRVGDLWVPADPLMLRVMCEVGALDAERWRPGRSVGPMVQRVGERPGGLLVTDLGNLETTLITSLPNLVVR